MFISVFNDKTWNEKIEKKERRVINKQMNGKFKMDVKIEFIYM